MHTSALRPHALAVLLGAAALAACSSDSTTKTAAPPALTLTATPTGMRPNGTATTAIHVAGGITAPITVTASNGTFVASGTKTDTIAGTAGDVTLKACDGATDSTCSGTITVTAIDAAYAAGKVTVTLIPKETICNDGIDNNGDGLIDCADPDCSAQVCAGAGGLAGICTTGTCVVPSCTPSPEICTDGIDNDCNGKIDCADTVACDGKPCKTGSPTFVCKTGVCTDVASGLGISVAPARTRIPADGAATTTVTVKLLSGGAPLANTAVTLSKTLGTVAPASMATDSNGEAVFTFTSDAAGGIATLTAAMSAIPQVSATTQIAMPTLGEIRFSSASAPVMGVKYSGYFEQNAVQVLLLDTEQKPYPDGLAVRFEHQQLGGSELSKPSTADTATCVAANKCIGYLGQTASPSGTPDTDGLAQVNLYSGKVAGLVSILASATAGGVDRSFLVQNIAIVGARASGASISIDCSPRNVPALMNADCTYSYYSGTGNPIACAAYFGDRFGNVLGVALRADFRSEAGEFGPPVYTKAYDPVAGGDQTKTLGFAVNSIAIAGRPLPWDVAPIPGEPRADYADGCSFPAGTIYTHNPRDGLVSVIVMAQGEEGFVDSNQNGVWDSGEPWIDQGEPFVDANDNGVWDPGEWFFDANGNGTYDGPNNQWDANTVIWAETRVLYTGLPLIGSAGGVPISYSNPASFSVNASTPGPATSENVDFYFADRNLNPLASIATYDFVAEGTAVTASLLRSPPQLDWLGMLFAQKYCDQPPGGAVPSTCSNVCPSSPCFTTTRVSGFGGPVQGTGLVTGGTDPVPNAAVDATATIEGVTTTLIIPGVVN